MGVSKLKSSLAEDYWFEKLLSQPQTTSFGKDQIHASEKHQDLSLNFPKEVSNKLNSIHDKNSNSAYLLFITALAVVVKEYVDNDDITIASTNFNHGDQNLEDTLVFFRFDLQNEKVKVKSLLENSLQQLNDANSNRQYEFNSLKRRLNIRNSNDYQKATQFGLIYEGFNQPSELETEIGVQFKVIPGDQFSVQVRFLTGEYDGDIINQLLQHYLRVVSNILSSTQNQLSELSVLSHDEIEWLINGANDAKTSYPEDKSLVQLFEEQVSKAPDKIAVKYNSKTFTYDEVNKQSNQIANYLRQNYSIQKDALVAIEIPRSEWQLITIIGVLKSGAGYVPIDTDHPKSRKEYIVSDANVLCMICHSSNMSEVVQYHPENLLIVDLQWDEIASYTSDNPSNVHSPDSLAYLMYTSGSTGKPKGVAVENRSVVRLVKSTNYTDINEENEVLQLSNYAFDGSVFDIYGSLLNGGTLHLIDKSLILSLKELGRYIEEEGVNTTFITSALFNSLIDTYPQCLKSCKKIYFGGESASISHIERALNYVSGKDVLVHVYGPTEGTTFTTYYNVPKLSPSANALPIGSPISNTEVYILGREGQLVPKGVEGELCIAGDGLARGYWGQAGKLLNTEKFVESDALSGKRIYKTGDIARYTSDGFIEFRGRRDNQLKIRGNRIELNEIEQALTSIEGVNSAFITVKDLGDGDKRIVAYYVLGGELSKESIINFLKNDLPEYMVPSYLMAVEKFPLTSNGKVNTKELPDPTASTLKEETGSVQPKNELERKIKAIWEDVLKTKNVSTQDNFFMIGGDSLKAIRIANQIQEELGEIVHVAALFESPTIEELSESIDKYRSVASEQIDEEKIKDFRQLVQVPELSFQPEEKNAPAVFILSAPRSGSTLLRSILGGHQDLFSPPELELLNFETLGERKEEFSDRFSFYREGVVKALMEINQCSGEEANKLMNGYEQRDITFQEMYAILQNGIKGRLLVDKSPFYTLDVNVLNRAEIAFDQAKYVFLVRNPYGMILSFEEAKIDQIFRREHTYNVKELAELIWIVSNQNILSFLKDIPEQRKHFITYESIVKEPESSIKSLCEFLEVEYSDALINIYDDNKGRMMDGVYEESKTLGDIKILSHKAIDATSADKWRNKVNASFLSEFSEELAESLGYSVDISSEQKIPALGEAADYEISHAQRRLWILSQIEEASLAYNSPQSWILEGNLRIDKFTKAFKTVVDRHEVLRTVFELVNDEPRQKVLGMENEMFQTSIIDLKNDDNAYERAEELVKKEAATTFSLTDGPLVRSKIILVDNDICIWSLNMHHIVCDAWSISNIFKEVTTVYNGLIDNKSITLSPLRIQYKDFAAWQNKLLNSEESDSLKKYWHKQLKDMPVMNFPTSYARTGKRNYGGKYLSYDLPQSTVALLRKVAYQNQSSLYITMLSVIKVLIYKYTGQEDILVGTSVAGRENKELEDQVGLYLNTLVMRTAISADDNFKETLEKVKNTVEGAYQHQMYPFNKIVNELHVDRDATRNPIIDIMVDMQSAKDQTESLNGIKVKNYYKEASYNKFDLVFNILDTEQGISVGIGFNDGLFSSPFIDELGASVVQLTQNLVTNQFIALKKHSALSVHDKERILEASSGINKPTPTTHLLDVFNEVVADNGDQLAVSSTALSLTYNELDKLSSQLSDFMQKEYNLQPGQTAGVMMDRSAHLLVSVLAVLKAGCVYIPIDPDYPESRKRFIIEDGSIAALITETSHLLELSTFFQGDMFFVDSQMDSISSYSSEKVSPLTSADAPVYAIYTSGSTGQPKGVLVNGASLLNLCQWHQDAFEVSAISKATLFAGIGFDASIWEMWPYLLSGSTLHPISDAMRLEMDDLVSYMSTQGVTHCFLPTPVCEEVAQLTELTLPKGLKVLTGGDRLHEIDLPGVELINNYGPTEGTVVSTSISVEEGRHGSSISIGHPITNTRSYVLDNDQGLLPKGVVGELYISGANLSMGYLNNPELTAEKFVEDPFTDASRMYATGDLCKRGESDQLFFIGRKDNQVKIRGYRVELSEVENVLLSHEKVTNSFVEVVELGRGQSLIGYYQSEAVLSQAELRDYMSSVVPSYMVPTYFMYLEELPTTANGKVDRSSFPIPDETMLTSGEHVSPRTELEKELQQIWEEVLGVEGISVESNFFEVGGHSLKAVQMVSRIYKKFDVKVDLNTIFLNPTIAKLAKQVEEKEKEEFVSIEPLPTQDSYEISHAQKRFWILDQKAINHTTYNMSEAYYIKGDLNKKAFSAAFKALVDRHESLRSTINIIKGEPRQVIQPAKKHGFEVEFLDLKDDEQKESKIKEIAGEEARYNFSLEEGSLLKALLIQTEDQEYVFIFTLHHIITDGWSMGVVLNDVLELYYAYDKGIAPRLEPMSIQYKDYAYWHNNKLKEQVTNSLKSYWLEQFADDIPTLNFPLDFERPAERKDEGKMYTLVFDVETTALIKEWSVKQKQSLFVTLMSLLNLLLYKYSGQEDIVVGTPIAGRDHIDLEDQVGFFVNTLALRSRFEGATNFIELQESVKETILDAYEHQFYPFDLLVEELGSKVQPGRSPLFDVLMILQNMQMREAEIESLEGIQVEKYEHDNKFSKYDLLFNFVEDGDNLVLSIIYDTHLFKHETIEQMAENFRLISNAVLRDKMPLTDIKLHVSNDEQSEHEEFLKSMQNL